MNNYTLPAEWEPQECMWLGWPATASDWPGKIITVRWAVVELIRVLTKFQPVNLLVQNKAAQKQAASMLGRAGVDLAAVHFRVIPYDRSWLRDSGPIFVKDTLGETVALCFDFTAWAKYSNYHLDREVPEAMARIAGVKTVFPTWKGQRVVLEGGAVDANGNGTILTTEECLLSPDTQVRNPGLGRDDYEAIFAQYLGASRTIWLDCGIAGDDTHGHVDYFCRFTARDTVVLCQSSGPADPSHDSMAKNKRRLTAIPDLQVVDLPMPEPLVFSGMQLPVSYANFTIANRCVLVPTFNDEADREALGILADLFPDRQVIGIHCTDVVWGLGAIHCLAKQQPR